MGVESTAARTSRLGNAPLCFGRIRDPDSIAARFEAIARKQVRNLAQEIFRL